MDINKSRFVSNFENLAQIGATKNGGIHRPTFSLAHLHAREWYKNACLTAGLEFKID